MTNLSPLALRLSQAHTAGDWEGVARLVEGMVATWQPIDTAEDHVKDAASASLMERGRFRARLYSGPDLSLYALWNDGPPGTPATLWARLPDVPLFVPSAGREEIANG